jgi:hypothetical protein
MRRKRLVPSASAERVVRRQVKLHDRAAIVPRQHKRHMGGERPLLAGGDHDAKAARGGKFKRMLLVHSKLGLENVHGSRARFCGRA